jgi:kumamolisin
MRGHLLTACALAFVALMALPASSLTAPAADLGGVLQGPPSSLSPLTALATDLGASPLDRPVSIVVGLQLRDRDGLDGFLARASDPASPDYQAWLTQDEFNGLYAPTTEQEAAVVAWLTDAGFTVTGTWSNHLLVQALGDNAAVQRAFGVRVHEVLFDGGQHFAVLDEPQFPASVAPFVTGVLGLDDLAQMQPLQAPGGDDATAKHRKPVEVTPNDSVGTACCYWSPRDTNAFYNEDHNGAHTGAGQTVVIVGAYDFLTADFTGFNAQMALSNPAVTRVCAGSGAGCSFNSQQSSEISLDVEYAHGTAPSAGLVSIMAQSTLLTDFTTAYNSVVTRNDGHSVSTSWGLCEKQMSSATRATDDGIFANGNALGQSWFAASGDSGSNDCPAQVGRKGVDYPASSPYIMGVGGTHGTCPAGSFTPTNPVCSGYGSEAGWSGSGGGDSLYYAKPSWQTGCTVPTGNRHVPDVSLVADSSPGYLVAFNGAWYAIGGTSAAAPQVAGMFAGLDQAKAAGGVGLPGTRLYQLCAGNSFHDITSGSNGAYSAVAGYDRVTGIGTINEGNLITNW